jgi:Mannosyltransferase (PIG-V)
MIRPSWARVNGSVRVFRFGPKRFDRSAQTDARTEPARPEGGAPRPRAARGHLELGKRRSPALEIFLWSRAAIWAAALFAWLVFEPNRHPEAARWDDPAVTRDLGWVTDIWARWDSVWFLRIAEHGYGSLEGAAAAFYPLYPATVGLLGRVFFGHYVLAGIVVSLAATLAAFVLFHDLAETKLGAEGARRAVLYLALFPMALFLQAVYSESLFLLLSVAAFVLAERRRFLPAGVVAGLALLTRPVGFALLPSLALFAWRAPERKAALVRLASAPLLFVVYPLVLWQQRDDPWAFARAQDIWSRHLSHAGPVGGIWDGLRAGWAGVRQLVSGSHTTTYWPAVDGTDPMRVAAVNLEALAFLILFLGLTVVAWRRFGAPYGLFAALSLAIPLSVPSERWPLLSLPRFGLTIFPLFLALAALGGRPRLHTAIVSLSSIFLGIAIAQWALWQWVA